MWTRKEKRANVLGSLLPRLSLYTFLLRTTHDFRPQALCSSPLLLFQQTLLLFRDDRQVIDVYMPCYSSYFQFLFSTFPISLCHLIDAANSFFLC